MKFSEFLNESKSNTHDCGVDKDKMHKDAMKLLAGDKVHSLYLAESYCDEESETHFSIYTGFVTVSASSYDDDGDDDDGEDSDEPIALAYSCKGGKVKEFYEAETKRDCVQEIKRKYPNAKKV